MLRCYAEPCEAREWRDGIWYCQQAEAQRATPSLFDLEEAV